MKNLSKKVKIGMIIAAAIIVLAIIVIVCVMTKKDVLEIYDAETGYKTTFKYPARKEYKVEKVDKKTGVFQKVIFTNEAKNVKFELYYYETSNSLYEINKTLRANNDNYKEYTFNKYAADSFTSGNVLQSDILLNKDENERNLVLYIYMQKINDEIETDMNEVFNSKEVQKILNTIKFEQVEVK